MPAQQRSFKPVVATAVNIPTTTETVVVTASPIPDLDTSNYVILEGVIVLTSGTGTTSVAIKCERGTAAGGTQVGSTMTETVTAGNAAVLAYEFTDSFGAEVSGQQYVITVTQTGATAAGTANYALVAVTVQ